MLQKKLFLAVLLASITASQMVFAADTTAGQFLSVKNTPVAAQQDLLQQTFQVSFPVRVITVGHAMQYLLNSSGYALAPNAGGYPLAKTMLARPLPIVDRNFGPLTIEQGLQTLAGPHFQMVVDPVNRLVAFRLKPSLAELYNVNGVTN